MGDVISIDLKSGKPFILRQTIFYTSRRTVQKTNPDAKIKFTPTDWSFQGFGCTGKTFSTFELWMTHVWQTGGREFILASKPNHTLTQAIICSLPLPRPSFNHHVCTHLTSLSNIHSSMFRQETQTNAQTLCSTITSVDKTPGGSSEVLL